MAFVGLTPPVPRSLKPAVRMSAQATKLGEVNITLSIHADILSMVPGAAERFIIECGTEGDAGVLRITREKLGAFKPRMLKGTAVFRLGATSFAPDDKQVKTECRWECAGRALRVKLPNWCAADGE